MKPGRLTRDDVLSVHWLRSTVMARSADQLLRRLQGPVRFRVQTRVGVTIWTRLWADCQIRATQKGGTP